MSNKWEKVVCLGKKQVLPSSQLGIEDLKVDLKNICFTLRFHYTYRKYASASESQSHSSLKSRVSVSGNDGTVAHHAQIISSSRLFLNLAQGL